MTTDTLRFLELAAKNSFRHVELDISKVEECVQRDGMPALRSKLIENHLKVVSLNAIENYPILTDEQMAKSIERCKSIFSLSNRLDCHLVVVNPSEFEPTNRGLMRQRFDYFVEEAANTAKEYGAQLGFEYVSYDNRVVNTLGKTLESLERWNVDLRLVLDIFHMYRSKERISRIPRKAMELL